MSKYSFSEYGPAENIQRKQKIITNYWRYFEKWSDSGKGLYLWSRKPGTGKTLLACCLGGSIRAKYHIHVQFISVPEYLTLVGKSYKQQPEERDRLFKYFHCGLLILDDLGSEKAGDWQNQELFRLIDGRMNERLPVIVTSNLPIGELKLDFRIIDRLNKMCPSIQMPEISIREKQSSAANRALVDEMLALP